MSFTLAFASVVLLIFIWHSLSFSDQGILPKYSEVRYLFTLLPSLIRVRTVNQGNTVSLLQIN